MNTEAFIRIRELFDSHQVDYHVLDHSPCRTSAESAAARAAAGFPEAVGAKALMVKMTKGQQADFDVLVLPGPSKLDSQALKDQFPELRRFRFATPEEMFDRCRVIPGCMPPFASSVFPQLGNLYVDELLLKYEWVGFNAASLERSIVVRCQDYIRVASPSAILRFAL
jgi:Ala-tRNA(Pro) deacylase